MTDMVDHLARTRAILDACAARGQWAQVAKIGGFKSEEAARAAYPNVRVRPRASNIKIPERDTSGMIAAAVALPERVFSNSQGVNVQPASREWVLKCRGRIAAMGLKIGDVSVSMGRCKSYVSNRFMATGYCSEEAKAAIEAHLDYLETQVKSA